MPSELNDTTIHELDAPEAMVYRILPPHRRPPCLDSKTDLFRPASNLDCLDCGALMIADGVAITPQGNDATTLLTLSPGAATVVSPKRLHLHLRYQDPGTSLKISSSLDAVLLFTAGLDWALQITGTLSCVEPIGVTRSVWSDCALFDVQVHGVGYRRATGPRGPDVLTSVLSADRQGLPTLAQIAREARR